MLSKSANEELVNNMSKFLANIGMAGMIKKQANNLNQLSELTNSLIKVADQLDLIGKSVENIDRALELLSEQGVKADINVALNETIEPKLALTASTFMLIKLADSFDAVGQEVVSNELDSALRKLGSM